MLSRFLVCRERFRLYVMEGLAPEEGFPHRLEYGNMWHVCEEAHAQGQNHEGFLESYCKELCTKYRMNQDQVDHWYNVCRVQFPYYVKYWESHPHQNNRTPLLQEYTFSVPYVLPSGRTVRLRGKWDAVDLIGKGKKGEVYLQENKTKGDVNPQVLQRQLTFDLQTMMYLIALRVSMDKINELHDVLKAGANVIGVRYNVIRRPLSGGKGMIRRHQPSKSNPDGESKESFYQRVAQYIIDEPETYFWRWTVDVTEGDYAKFRETFFDPILESLCDWWEWVNGDRNRNENRYHWRLPYGVWNSVTDNVVTALDEYMIDGSMVGLQRRTNLFPELD